MNHPTLVFPTDPPPELLAIRVELRNATDASTVGNLDLAITHPRCAELLASKGWGLDPASCLRLPMYLQRASRSIEAWAELHALLSPDHPALSYGVSGRILWLATNHSQIYDKMRIFLQREGKPALAACYSVMSYVYEADNWRDNIADLRAHHIATRDASASLRSYRDPGLIESTLTRDLRRANLLGAVPALIQWTRQTLKTRLPTAGNALLDPIRTVLGVTESYP